MNNKPNPDRSFLHFMLRAQQLARQDARSDKGYAMLMTSLISIALFSMLAAYFTMTNLSKSSTNAYVNGTNTFYAAESGLNKRAQQLREKFIGYASPTGLSPGQTVATDFVTTTAISNCFPVGTSAPVTTNDFECRNYSYRYNNNIGRVNTTDGSGATVVSEQDGSNVIDYTAFTFVADKTNYVAGSNPRSPTPTTITDGVYAGLNAQEYQYTVYATAAKKDPSIPVPQSEAKTVLQLDFKSRIIPLFQFAIFYDDDLEMNSTSRMDITGRVHTNRNFYLQPTQGYAGAGDTTTGTFFTESITAAGKIYNRVDASNNTTPGMPRMKTGGTDAAPIYTDITPRRGTPTTPLGPATFSAFAGKIKDGARGAAILNPPEASFLRKQNKDGVIGEYYGKAEIRLEMLPDRTAVPFEFTTIQTGTGARGTTCAASLNVSSDRQEYSTVKCNVFTEGQLRSLMQPVLVMPNSLEEAKRFCDPTLTAWTAPSVADKKTLQGLALAVAANPTPLSINTNLKSAVVGGSKLDTNLTTLAVTFTGTPDGFARTKGSCFIPAPIQRLATESGSLTAPTVTSTYRERRENRWLTMLQTNIESLTVWNRDGVFVTLNGTKNERDDVASATLTDAFTKVQANDPLASANGLVFKRAAADTTSTTLAMGSFQRLGLAAADRTEGGLVYHASVSDDLNGDGVIDTNDVAYDTGSLILNKQGATIAYRRTYPSTAGVTTSPYGFAFSGGINLPGPLTITTDQGAYMQGDYNECGDYCRNTNADNTIVPTPPRRVKTPASILADTITVLSNNCQSPDDKKLNCGINGADGVFNNAVRTRMNAAFLSNTDRSIGNVNPATDTLPGGATRYSGGINNYMRMVENWTGVPFVYRGSFISLGAPLEFSGAYRSGGNYYNIPIRDFGFDTDFRTFTELPPLTPKVIYLQQDVFRRDYK
jgi:hypothetical protein